MVTTSHRESLPPALRQPTYLPDDADSLPWLASETWQRREALFAAWVAQLETRHPGSLAGSELSETVREHGSKTPEERAAIVMHPVFALQVDASVRHVEASTSLAAVTAEATAVADAYRRARAAVRDPELTRVGGIEVRRWDVDPVIAAAAPPTYTFPAPEVAARRVDSDAYTLEVFCDVARAALSRIATVWPQLAQQIRAFVPVIVHIPDAPYRSASAARYRGVVFLSSDDVTLLEVEESMVHEFGHQVLYRAMMLDPLVADGETSEYVLPWSGSRRDFYGYFHAFYIYLLLAKYLERALEDAEHDRTPVERLLGHIADGLPKACPDFEPDDRFTEAGQRMAARLQEEALAIGRRCGL